MPRSWKGEEGEEEEEGGRRRRAMTMAVLAVLWREGGREGGREGW